MGFLFFPMINYGAPLGGPLGRRSSAITYSHVNILRNKIPKQGLWSLKGLTTTSLEEPLNNVNYDKLPRQGLWVHSTP